MDWDTHPSRWRQERDLEREYDRLSGAAHYLITLLALACIIHLIIRP